MSILHKTHLSCLPSLECTSPPCVAGDLEIRLSLLGKKFVFIWYAIVKKNTQCIQGKQGKREKQPDFFSVGVTIPSFSICSSINNLK